ncbi:hypothetical protein Nepgr_020887 [Nepenthes gracilis]|uniref:Uncharacterized protein n=1 Tax=Nepenthes gracilis TaxID=150966 RepID=A0AAD3SY33_NEPGR|nr:hypothetical protein Nepgr_020887 [Nepenthes gracilis]
MNSNLEKVSNSTQRQPVFPLSDALSPRYWQEEHREYYDGASDLNPWPPGFRPGNVAKAKFVERGIFQWWVICPQW